VNIFHNNIYPNLTKNIENIGQILFALRLKTWLLYGYSQNPQMPLNIMFWPPTLEFTKIAQEMWTVEAEIHSRSYVKY